jgi:hypothetical protein
MRHVLEYGILHKPHLVSEMDLCSFGSFSCHLCCPIHFPPWSECAPNVRIAGDLVRSRLRRGTGRITVLLTLGSRCPLLRSGGPDILPPEAMVSPWNWVTTH